jgi:cytochrome c oxidase subunit IV
MTDTIEDKAANPYKSYWITWAILLAITVGMLMAEELHLPKWFLLVFLLVFMAVKAVMIAGNFMHLRHEQRNLAVMVAAGIVVTSLILYTYVSFESRHVLERTIR